MRVKVLKGLKVGKEATAWPGQVVDLSDYRALEAIAMGKAEPAPAETAEPEQKPKRGRPRKSED
jgi:hypothetical protein